MTGSCGYFEQTVSFSLPHSFNNLQCFAEQKRISDSSKKSHQIQLVAFWPVLNHKESLKFNNQLCLFDFSPWRLTIQQMYWVWRGRAQSFLHAASFILWHTDVVMQVPIRGNGVEGNIFKIVTAGFLLPLCIWKGTF